MKIIGLTGSIAMGKTTIAAMLRRAGIPVFDADAAVHQAIATDKDAIAAIAAAFPNAVRAGKIDRRQLGAIVFGNEIALHRLETILHPCVRAAEKKFIAGMRRQGRLRVALDIPLLFETGGEKRCDLVLLVTAPTFLQEMRALARPGMTRPRLAAIRARQMAEAEKRRRADFVIETGLGRRFAWARLCRWLSRPNGRPTGR